MDPPGAYSAFSSPIQSAAAAKENKEDDEDDDDDDDEVKAKEEGEEEDRAPEKVMPAGASTNGPLEAISSPSSTLIPWSPWDSEEEEEEPGRSAIPAAASSMMNCKPPPTLQATTAAAHDSSIIQEETDDEDGKKENFGLCYANTAQPVEQFVAATGQVIGSFRSLRAAGKANGLDAKTVKKLVQKGGVSTDGSSFRVCQETLAPKRPTQNFAQPVEQFVAATGQVIGSFRSLSAAGKANGLAAKDIKKLVEKGGVNQGRSFRLLTLAAKQPSQPKPLTTRPKPTTEDCMRANQYSE